MKGTLFKYLLLTIVLIINSCNSFSDGRSDLRLGNKKYINGLYNESESKYLKSLYQQGSIEAFYGLGNSLQRQAIYTSQEKIDTIDSLANKAYKDGIGQNSNNKKKLCKLFHNQGNLYLTSGLRFKNLQKIEESNQRFEHAIMCYKSALRINPNDNETRYNLALSIYLLNKNQKSINNNQNKDNQSNQDTNKNKEESNKENNKNDSESQNDKNNSDNHQSNKNNASEVTNISSEQLDERTINQLLNSAQRDENNVHKKIENASMHSNSNEKDW